MNSSKIMVVQSASKIEFIVYDLKPWLNLKTHSQRQNAFSVLSKYNIGM